MTNVQQRFTLTVTICSISLESTLPFLSISRQIKRSSKMSSLPGPFVYSPYMLNAILSFSRISPCDVTEMAMRNSTKSSRAREVNLRSSDTNACSLTDFSWIIGIECFENMRTKFICFASRIELFVDFDKLLLVQFAFRTIFLEETIIDEYLLISVASTLPVIELVPAMFCFHLFVSSYRRGHSSSR